LDRRQARWLTAPRPRRGLAGRERLDHRASGQLPGVAERYGFGQDLLHRAQIGDLPPDFGKVPSCNLAHLGACATSVSAGQRKQGTDFVERETEFAGAADEGERAAFGRAVDPPAAGGAVRCGVGKIRTRS